MLKAQCFGSSTGVAPASVCHVQRPLLIRSSKGKGKGNGMMANNVGAFVVPNYRNFPQKQKMSRIGNGIGAGRAIRRFINCREIKAAATTTTLAAPAELVMMVKTKVIVKKLTGEDQTTSSATVALHNHKAASPKSLKLQFLSTLLDPKGRSEKLIPAEAKLIIENKLDEIYEASFEVPLDFGDIGAVIVENHNEKEMFVKEVELSGLAASGAHTISCNSWIQPNTQIPEQRRVFFTNKSYLPSQTPAGLKSVRETELVNLRGNGSGQRQSYDRIYDYDVYNDLGTPDDKRPILGGPQRPYPRRCRTGRPHSKTDPHSEEPAQSSIYVPRDETFSDLKEKEFQGKYFSLQKNIKAILAGLQDTFGQKRFPNFNTIDAFFDIDGYKLLPSSHESTSILERCLHWLVKPCENTEGSSLRFDPPKPMDRDKFFWLSDEEFGRQTLAGINPCSIQLVRKWPLTSQLDPAIYGPPESAFNSQMIDQQIGSMTVEEAIEKKKLFVLDYHDTLLPYVQKVRSLDGTTLYGSRTLFYLNEDSTLKPLAIELTRPPMDGKPQWKRVYEPNEHGTSLWLWRLAKAHVLSHDSGYHQLISHWLRTHCVVEPYVIATNRQLSAMHPIYRLVHPHLRYTLEINAKARSILINGGGIIESTFSPLKYCMELSSTVYDLQWQFDLQALPADLIHRGLAEEDPSSSHGLKLHIKDYPFANDGLILWDALKAWVTEYVNHYYPDSYLVTSDTELQAWWSEIRNVGHGDKQDEPWWPLLNTPQDLINIITNIAWIASGHHAAVNFGQYDYAAYFPSRPTIARTNMPFEDSDPELEKSFFEKPENVLLSLFPSEFQAAQVMVVMDVLSSHSLDEEYVGKNMEASWGDDPVIKAAFNRFSENMKQLEHTIDRRNDDRTLKNRTGAGVTPYELLKPFSGPDVTAKGVPYSVSI